MLQVTPLCHSCPLTQHGSGISTAKLHGSGFNRWLNMEAVSTAELHGSGANRWLNMEAVLLIAIQQEAQVVTGNLPTKTIQGLNI
jgi:hypothetical protein